MQLALKNKYQNSNEIIYWVDGFIFGANVMTLLVIYKYIYIYM